MRLCQPFFILKLLEQVSVRSEWAIDFWTSLMVVTVFLRFIFYKQYLFSSQKVALKLRIAISYIIFKKALQRKVNSMGQLHPMNLLTNDVSRLEMILPHLAWLWIGPLFLIGIVIILYFNCHYMAVICILVLYLLFIIISLLLGKVVTKMRKVVSKFTDTRLRLLSEIIGGIHIIKLYAWEDAFERLIKNARRNEVRQLSFATIIKSFFDCMHFVIDRIQMILVLVTCTLIDVRLMTHEMFGIILLLTVARTVVTGQLPYAFSQFLDFNASLDRIQSFLETDSVKENEIMAVNTLEAGCLDMQNVSASWKSGTEVLHYINFYLQPGKFCAIVGPVGSGKTSLLNAVLSELPVFHGSVCIGGTVSYAPQEPWIFHGTVRDNILFGEKFDQQRYDEVLRVCALRTDLEQLSHGDGTLVGERGVKLSGGQKARIGLARAVYKAADIYLLDDPLSAVDMHVSKRLFQDCIMTFLQGKTRVLVTHHIQNLPHTDHVIVINEGSIQVQGTFQEVTESGIAFGTFLNVNYEELDDPESLDDQANDNIEEIREEPQDNLFMNAKGHMISDVWKYIKQGAGTFVFALYIIIILANLASYYIQNYFCGIWASVTAPFDQAERFDFLLIIFYVLVSIIVFTVLRTVFGCIVMLSASSRMHLSMVKSIMATNLRFFHTTPSGSIMAYFSDDIAILDEQLPRTFEWLFMLSCWVVTNTVIVGLTNHYTWASMIPLMIIICAIVKVTTAGINNFKELESFQRGKYFSKVVDAVRGCIIIRALRKTEFILEDFNRQQDEYTSSKILNIEMRVAQNFILSLCAALLIGSNTVILMKTGFRLDPVIVGFGFLYTMFTEELTNIMLEHLGHSTSHFNSIKNCLNVTNLPEEVQKLSIGNDKLWKNKWPSTGDIEFVNVSLQYCEKGPFVLNGVSFSINSGEKIGVVGRTGAGKSSLVSALLRLAILKDDGSILVDSVNTRQVPLNVLRRSITVIPQEPVLFTGTVRDNLDPFNELKDAALWNALKHVELSSHVTALDALVEERGSNWSVGQRQLLCLVRASLWSSRILVLDEATASIDLETDKVIQTAIRRLFKDCTVITIAHRLNTIMDSDRVLVIDSGRLVEFDSPFRLVDNTNSYFYKLVRHSGKDMLEEMELVARKAYWTGTDSNTTIDTRL